MPPRPPAADLRPGGRQPGGYGVTVSERVQLIPPAAPESVIGVELATGNVSIAKRIVVVRASTTRDKEQPRICRT